MSLKRRLERLEVGKGNRRRGIPWSVDDPEATGLEVDGRFLSWEAFYRAYPGGPFPLRWGPPAPEPVAP